MRSSRRFRLLLGLWSTYWTLLAALTLGPLALAILRATSGPEGGRGGSSVTGNFSSTVLSAVVTRQGQVTYSASVHLLTAALWIAGPPLLVWLGVMFAGRRDTATASRVNL